MSIGRMRRWSRLVAMILLLSAARGLPHLAQDDASCAQTDLGRDVRHDRAGQAMRAGSGLLAADRHCAVCHFIRSLRSPLVVVDTGALQLAPPVLASSASSSSFSAPDLEHLPARAPPSA